MTRLQSLRNRREILINANVRNHYTTTGNEKIEKYYKCMLSIRREINDIECVNVRPLKAIVGLTLKSLLENQKIWNH